MEAAIRQQVLDQGFEVAARLERLSPRGGAIHGRLASDVAELSGRVLELSDLARSWLDSAARDLRSLGEPLSMPADEWQRLITGCEMLSEAFRLIHPLFASLGQLGSIPEDVLPPAALHALGSGLGQLSTHFRDLLKKLEEIPLQQLMSTARDYFDHAYELALSMPEVRAALCLEEDEAEAMTLGEALAAIEAR